jgi:hypothetical protein
MGEVNNLSIWNAVKQPPLDALKKIKGGRLSGMSDISPQWRYQILTEQFGPCGVGWKYTIKRVWEQPATEGQEFAFAEVDLFIKFGAEWSDPIPGIGGSMLIAKETKGLYSSDEAYKMAVTDALSVAMKMVGVAADVYAGKFDGSKYAAEKEPEKPVADEQLLTINTMYQDLVKAEKIKDMDDFKSRLKRLYGTTEVEKLTETQANGLIKKLGMIS